MPETSHPRTKSFLRRMPHAALLPGQILLHSTLTRKLFMRLSNRTQLGLLEILPGYVVQRHVG
jgi:hypothetical protein